MQKASQFQNHGDIPENEKMFVKQNILSALETSVITLQNKKIM